MIVPSKASTTIAVTFAALSFTAHANEDDISLAADALWGAFEASDLDAFDKVLSDGVLDTHAFERHEAHFTLCEATLPGKEIFLRSILSHDIDPDVQNPTVSALDRNALACAATRYNIEAFDMLLDAGADTSANLCAGCSRPRTLFTITANKPPFSSRILDRRRLTPFEVENLAWQVENIQLANSHEGQVTYEWYQDLLRDYGVDGLEPLSARYRK